MSLEMQFFYKFIFWVFSIYGINQIIVESTLFSSIRKNTKFAFFKSIINCFLCNSVWVAFLVSYLIWSPFRQAFTTDLYSSDISYVFFKYAERYEDLTDILIPLLHFIIKIISMFFDGMIGSAIVWIIHAYEIKLIKN